MRLLEYQAMGHTMPFFGYSAAHARQLVEQFYIDNIMSLNIQLERPRRQLVGFFLRLDSTQMGVLAALTVLC